MSTQGLRKCCHCDIWFRPHGRNAHHQLFCLKPDCRAASKRASQKKWSRKNPGYFHGDAYVKKVQAWRRNHPGYWKTTGAKEDCGPPDALQDLLVTQGFGNEDVKVFRNCLSAEISQPLQDLLIAQSHALKGLASMITGEELQDDIDRILTTCYEQGQRIGGKVPWMQPQEVKHERPRTHYAAEAAPHTAAI